MQERYKYGDENNVQLELTSKQCMVVTPITGPSDVCYYMCQNQAVAKVNKNEIKENSEQNPE